MPIVSFKTRHGRVRFSVKKHRKHRVPPQLRPFLFTKRRKKSR